MHKFCCCDFQPKLWRGISELKMLQSMSKHWQRESCIFLFLCGCSHMWPISVRVQENCILQCSLYPPFQCSSSGKTCFFMSSIRKKEKKKKKVLLNNDIILRVSEWQTLHCTNNIHRRRENKIFIKPLCCI